MSKVKCPLLTHFFVIDIIQLERGVKWQDLILAVVQNPVLLTAVPKENAELFFVMQIG